MDYLITDSACYIRNNPTTVQPLTRYSLYREMWLVCFYGISISRIKLCKIMQKSDQKLHIGISCKRVFMIFAWNIVSVLCDNFFFIFRIMFMQFRICVKFLRCSHENYSTFLWKLNDKTEQTFSILFIHYFSMNWLNLFI